MSRVDHVIVGYDVTRTASLTLGTAAANSTLVEGEVIVLDSNGELMTAGQTVSDSEWITLGVGTPATWTEVNGYTRREIKYSAPIYGSGVKSYKGLSYVAATQRTATFTTGLTPSTTNGAYDYVFRIVYKEDHVAGSTPGQYATEYRVTSDATNTATLTALYAYIDTLVTADTTARVATTAATNSLIFTGVALTSDTLTSIDEFFSVDFEVFFYQVPLTGSGAGIAASTGVTPTYNTAVRGSGLWQEIRDMEKKAKLYGGPINIAHFPQESNLGTFFTVKNKTYDQIVIEHDNPFAPAGSTSIKTVPDTTVIALPNNTYTTVQADVLSILNPWIASCPAALPAVVL